jgi:hypothetical protein
LKQKQAAKRGKKTGLESPTSFASWQVEPADIEDLQGHNAIISGGRFMHTSINLH